MSLQLQTCMSCSVQRTRAETECHLERRSLGLRVNKCPFPTLLGSYCRNITNRSRRRRITVIVNAKEDSSLPASGTEVTFDSSDLVTLEYGRLLGESREKTLSKIVAKKLYPDASYLEIEKMVKKRKDLLGTLKISDLEMALRSAKLSSKPINQNERSPQASNDLPKLSSPVQPEKIIKLSQKPRFQTKGRLDEFKVDAKPLLNVGSMRGDGDANIDELVLQKPSITGATSNDTPSPLSGMKVKSRVRKPVKETGKEDLCLSNSNENMDESMTTLSSQNDANVPNLAQHPIGGHMQESFGATKSAAVPSLASRPSWGKAVKIQTKEEMSSSDPQLTTGATAEKKMAVKEARDVSLYRPSLASPPKRHKDSMDLFYEAQPTGIPATVQKGNSQDITLDDVILRKPVPLQSSDATAAADSDNPEPPLHAEEAVLPPSLEDESSSLSKSKSNLEGEKSFNSLTLDPPESHTDSKDNLLEIRTTLTSPSAALNAEDESVGLSTPSSPLQGCEGLGLLYDSTLVAPSSIKNADTGNSALESVTLRRPLCAESTVEEDVSVETKLETHSIVSVSSSKEGNIVNDVLGKTLLRKPISFENDEAYSASFAKEALSLEIKSQPLQCESPGVEPLNSSVKQKEQEEQNILAEVNNVDGSLQVQRVEKRAPSGINTTHTDKVDRRIQRPMQPQNRESYGHHAKEDEDQEWIRAETLMKSKEHVEVKLIGHSKTGLLASFGCLDGLLPMLELSPKRGLLDYSDWVQQHESDLTQTIRQDTILPNSEHEEFSSTKKAESKKANDLRRKFDEEISQKFSLFVGEKVTVVVTSVDKESRRLRFSEIEADPKYREVILKKEELLNELKVGDVVSCKVKNITPIGIFVELEGVSAFIHRSEISWNPGVGATSFLSIGEIIKAQVCRLDKALKRINLSLKSLQPDPLKLTLESVVGDTEGESVIHELEAIDTQEPDWAELESLIRNLQQLDSIESVSNGRRLCGTALAPTFQVLLSAPQNGGYKLLVRSGKQIQEVLVRTTLDWESMKKCIQMCTFADPE